MPTPGLPNERHHLPLPGSRVLQRLARRRQLGSRPTKRVSPRATAACKRGRTARPQLTQRPPPAPPAPSPVPAPRATSTWPSTSRSVSAVSSPLPGGRAAPCARPGPWSGPPRCSPCAGRCQWPAPPPHRRSAQPGSARRAVAAAHLLGIAPQGVLHGQGGIAGAAAWSSWASGAPNSAMIHRPLPD